MKTITIFFREYAMDGEPIHCIDVPFSEENIRKLQRAEEQHVICSAHAAIFDVVGAISRCAGRDYRLYYINVPGIGVIRRD